MDDDVYDHRERKKERGKMEHDLHRGTFVWNMSPGIRTKSTSAL